MKYLENKLLNELVKDCVLYRLKESEALEYIKVRFHIISEASYKRRKAGVMSHGSTNIWLGNLTRIGYVSNHKKHIESIEAILDDSLQQFFYEKDKENRDERKIQQLKDDIRENTKLLSELNLGTPIIAAIKARLEQNEKRVSISK